MKTAPLDLCRFLCLPQEEIVEVPTRSYRVGSVTHVQCEVRRSEDVLRERERHATAFRDALPMLALQLAEVIAQRLLRASSAA